jgi:hypothetical protein
MVTSGLMDWKTPSIVFDATLDVKFSKGIGGGRWMEVMGIEGEEEWRSERGGMRLSGNVSGWSESG